MGKDAMRRRQEREGGGAGSDAGGDGVGAPARLVVDLGALRGNYRFIAEAAGCAGAVVKADGYGLGATEVLAALRQEGCVDFFVATVAEGVALREVDSEVRIYVFSGPIDEASARAMAERNLTPVLNDVEQVVRWRPYDATAVAVHVDTGMNRLGFASDALTSELFKGLNVRLLLSHLANADQPADPMNARQMARFEAVAALFPGVPTSLGNSAGVLLGAMSELARPGIALYGGNPFATLPNPMRPVASLEARVLALRDLSAGEPVGYGGTYVTDEATRVAVLGIGYADGVPRCLANAEVAYRGRRLPVIARVSMDLMHVDVTTVADSVRLGDWIELFGHTVSVDETAAWAGTVSYEVLTGIGARVPRYYIDD